MTDKHMGSGVRGGTFIGLFMVTLGTLMYEILLTRFFSVMMWYHFSFVAISVAMFGMTVGAILVYLYPGYFRPEHTHSHMAKFSAVFALTMVASSLAVLCIPVMMQPPGAGHAILWICSLGTVYVIAAIPLVMSGIVVCLALTRFPRAIGRLYAADLAGAAAGCIALIAVLRIGDGPTSIFFLGTLGGIAALSFAEKRESRRFKNGIALFTIACGLAFLANSYLAANQSSLLRLIWVKGRMDGQPRYERWNSFSRVAVYGDPDELVRPTGWGLSPVYPRTKKFNRLYLDIDAYASTVLPKFQDNLDEVDYLQYDMVQLAHHVRKDADVLVMGAGGGSDILAAMYFKQRTVTGVEINKNIFKAANRVFSDFTGHLDWYPGVTIAIDDARSYIARQTNSYDIIQASLIDSFAATAAGAFTLTENALYTIEGWDIFMDHLTPEGMLTFSRVYVAKSPGEIYRLVALAVETLRRAKVENPRDHIVLTKLLPPGAAWGVGTILVAREPFTDTDLDTVERVCREMEFEVVLSPRTVTDDHLATIVHEEDLSELSEQLHLNIEAPTDNAPFYFHMLKFKDILRPSIWMSGPHRTHLVAPVILLALLFVVIILTICCIGIPLHLATDRGVIRSAKSIIIYFAAIGFGFMLVEISQMQRLSIFLGHPVYGLSVTLFSILLSAGAGSFTVERLTQRKQYVTRLLMLLFMLGVYMIVLPPLCKYFTASTTTVRILSSVLVLSGVGFFMGMAFPIGMKLAAYKVESLTPILWGINGATSVVASVLAVFISINWGVRASFLVGAFFYILALAAFLMGTRGGFIRDAS